MNAFSINFLKTQNTGDYSQRHCTNHQRKVHSAVKNSPEESWKPKMASLVNLTQHLREK